MSHAQLSAAVRTVLKNEAKKGQTTRQSTSILVMKRIENAGGPTKFGIGAAAMRMALFNIISTEVMRQLKSSLSSHNESLILPKTLPDEVKGMLVRLPHWIAIEEGQDALWKYWRKATAIDWLANAMMKHKKAQQTLDRMRDSEDIALYLDAHGLTSLGDLFE